MDAGCCRPFMYLFLWMKSNGFHICCLGDSSDGSLYFVVLCVFFVLGFVALNTFWVLLLRMLFD